MAAAAPKVGWIARQWRKGWEEIPLLMAAHCITTPLVIGYLLCVAFDAEIYRSKPEKYRAMYTVIRSDDERIKRISHYSHIDKVGLFK